MEAPIIPIWTEETDTSNFIKESKKIKVEESETPFPKRAKSSKALIGDRKNIEELKSYKMKRIDVLHQFNQKLVEKLEQIQKNT